MALAGNSFSFLWEVSLMEWLQSSAPSALVPLISALSMFGEELILVAILGFVYWSYDKKMGKYIGCNVLMLLVWSPMIKNVFLRRRPYFDHDGIKILRVVEPEADIYDIAAQGYSFPSGHSANSLGVFGSLAVCGKKKWLTAAAVVLPLLVGFSRVFVGAHFPTDVLAGWALALIAMLVVPRVHSKINNENLFRLLMLAAALPGIFYCRSTDYFTGLGLLIGFVAGSAFEEKIVNFAKAEKPLGAVLRVLGGMALFFVLNTVLKLPFSSEFLGSGTFAALMVRCARYALVSFIEFGVYPMAFSVGKKRKEPQAG